MLAFSGSGVLPPDMLVKTHFQIQAVQPHPESQDISRHASNDESDHTPGNETRRIQGLIVETWTHQNKGRRT